MKWKTIILAVMVLFSLVNVGIDAKELLLEIKGNKVDYYDDFTTDDFLKHAMISEPERLIHGDGSIGVNGRTGYSVNVDLTYHVKVEKPLVDLVISCAGSANLIHLGGEFKLAVSKDGENWVGTQNSKDLKTYSNGTTLAGEELVIENAEKFIGEATEFWIRLTLRAGAGVETKSMPARINSFSIEGKTKNK